MPVWGDYYGPFDAQKIFDEIPVGALETQPLKIDHTFYCFKCDGMASMRTCPHSKEDRLMLSGTKLRKMLSEGENVPDHFSVPKCSRSSRSTMPASPQRWRSSFTAMPRARIRRKSNRRFNDCGSS